MRLPPATVIALALAFIASLAALEGWRRATLAVAQVAELREEIRDFDGALQALHQDLDELRGDARRATEAAERAAAAAGGQPASGP